MNNPKRLGQNAFALVRSTPVAKCHSVGSLFCEGAAAKITRHARWMVRSTTASVSAKGSSMLWEQLKESAKD
jgi:hypothetical protein